MADIPEWAAKKAAELANRETKIRSEWSARDAYSFSSIRAFARYIAEHETAPVDPDVLAVRELISHVLEDGSENRNYVHGVRDGHCDNNEEFQSALAIYREHASRRGAA